MPQLLKLELWRCGEGQACSFLYLAGNASASDQPEMTWYSSRPTPGLLQSEAMDSWSDLAQARHPRAEKVKVIEVDPGLSLAELRSWFGLVPYLTLTRAIIHPESLRQIESDIEKRTNA